MIGKDDLIRRQDAIKALEKWKEGEARTVKDYGEVFVLGRTSAFVDAIAAMVFVPSVEPEIIRCKDCKHWYDAPVIEGYNSCELDALIRQKDFYCANAERRTDE